MYYKIYSNYLQYSNPEIFCRTIILSNLVSSTVLGTVANFNYFQECKRIVEKDAMSYVGEAFKVFRKKDEFFCKNFKVNLRVPVP